jgi:hypothetical protein
LAETENLKEKEQKPEPEINTEELTAAFNESEEQPSQETPAELPDQKTERYIEITRKGIRIFRDCAHKNTEKVVLLVCSDCGKILKGGEKLK